MLSTTVLTENLEKLEESLNGKE